MKLKKLAFAGLAAATVLSLTACNGGDATTTATKTGTAGGDTTTQKPAEKFANEKWIDDADDETVYDNVWGKYEEYAHNALEATNVNERYYWFAKAEAWALDQALYLPTESQGGNYAINRTVPGCGRYAQWGYDDYRYDAVVTTTEFIKKEDVADEDRGYLGIVGGTITSSQQEYYGLPEGVYVSEVDEDGPAKDAGILAGDIITGINDIKISSMDDLSSQIKSYKAGTTVTITYKRLDKGEYKEDSVDVKLINIPDKVEKKEDTKDKEEESSDKDSKKEESGIPNEGNGSGYGYPDDLEEFFYPYFGN